MKIMSVKHSFVAVSAAALVATALAPFSAIGDWTQNDGSSSTAGKKQDIVITLKLDPVEHPDAACLAVTLARSLRGDFSQDGARATKAKRPTKTNVTLFPTLDGVTIGDADVVSDPEIGKCATPEGQITFQENLEDFLCDTGNRDDCPYPDDLNMNNLVECPLCWSERYPDQMPDYGVLNPAAVNDVLLNAEKVIDF
jgi:hypothetical protein